MSVLASLVLAFSVILAPGMPQAGGEDPEAAPAASADEADLGALPDDGQVLDALDPIDDDRIAARLRGILAATGRLPDVSVRVESGVVFLEGTVDTQARADWVRELARKLEGVVAVFEDLEPTPAPLWDLQPALSEARELLETVVQGLPLLVVGLAVLALTLLGSRAFAAGTVALVLRRSHNRILAAALQKVVLVAIVLLGAYVFLRISGLTRVAATLIGGTGLLGLIVGLAFRDIAENMLASLLISIQRPFRIGDTIEVEGHVGLVHRVTLRGTVLMDFDGNHIQIANATIYKSTIKNYTANPKLRTTFTVGVGYDADPAEAQQLVLDVLSAHEAVLDDPRPTVLLERLGSATIELVAYYWIDGHVHDKLKVRSALLRQAVRALEAAGVSLPDEAREVVFPQAVPVRMLREDAATSAPERPRAADPAVRSPSRAQAAEPEGDLSSDVEELRAQAESSRGPDEGAALLTSDAPA